MLVAAYAATGSLYAQSSSTIGTEFWFGFMPNYNGASDRITLVASSLTPATITVESYLGDSSSIRSEVFQLIPTNIGDTIGSMTIELNPFVSETRSYETPVYRSVHVSSNAPISLSAYTYKRGSGEGMLVLPVTTYGKEYRTLNYPTYRGEGETYPGQFIIVSPFDNNVVTITTKAYTENSNGVESHAPETSWQVQLQKGQTYLVRSSTKLATNITDLTGSHITSTRPVAVVSGHQYTKLDAPYGSTFFEMLPPVESWSKKYYYNNYDPNRRSTVIIVAADTGTFYYTSTQRSSPNHMKPGDRVEEEVFYGEGMYLVSSTSSRFLAYELRRSKDIATDLKAFPPVMTLITSPNDKDNMFIMNYPPLFDSLSGDVAEETVYEGRLEDISEIFKSPTAPALTPVPLQPNNYFYRTSSGYTEPHTKSFYNRAPVTAMMTGTNGIVGFGHTSSLRYTKRSTDLKAPYITLSSSPHCGNYDIHVTDDVVTNPFTVESGMLASVRVITQGHDITMLPAARNYRIVRANDFSFGSQTDNFKLEVINPQLDAYAAVFVEDLAGNDTTYIFTYTAGKTPLSLSKGTGNKIPVGKEVCITLPLFPKGDSSSAPVHIESVQLKNGLSNPRLQSVWPALPAILDHGDTLFVTICAIAQDTAFFVTDSLLVFADCYERSYPINAKGETGLLSATDASLCDKHQPHHTYSSIINLQNKGELPLSITSYSVEGKSKDKFWIDPTWDLPQGISKNSFYSVKVFYRGTEFDAKDTAIINWQTDVNPPYSNSIKTYSTLTGCTASQTGVRDEANKTLSISSLTPNPAKEYLQLHYFSTSKITMTVINELGVESLKFELMPSEGPEASTRINLPQLPNGSYTLRLQNTNGEVASRRFVVVK